MVISARYVLIPLFVMLMAYPMLSLDRIGMELQNPFDTRRVDHLPLEALCSTIEGNLVELVESDPVAGGASPYVTDAPLNSNQHHKGNLDTRIS